MENKVPMSKSKSIKSTQVFPEHTNHLNTMFGGKIMANMDEVAAITAMKHSGINCVTASIDSIDFIKPIRTGDIVTYEGVVSYVGRSSMEICVQIRVDDPKDHKSSLAALSFLTFVAINDDGTKRQLPKVYPETEVEKWLYETSEARVNNRQDRRIQTKGTIKYLTKFMENN